MSTTISNLITLDGNFTDWPAAYNIATANNTVAGYNVFGTELADTTLGNTYVIGIQGTTATNPTIGAGTTIWLNTDQNAATGLSPGTIGAEYYIQMATDNKFYLYNSSYGLVSPTALYFGLSADGKSVEVAVPQSLVTLTGGTAPHSINIVAAVTNPTAGTVTQFLPGTFTPNTEYTITDPSTLITVDHSVKKVGIVYSATSATLYFGGGAAGQTAYSDLFMAAQHQAEAAGVSYDILSESDLTNVSKLAQYSALVFPDMQNVQSAQASAIENALHQVVYNYHVPIISAGAFMTNDQTGAALTNTFGAMQDLLGATQTGYGTATYSITPDATAIANHNAVLSGYAAGQLIGGASGQFAATTAGYYNNAGYLTFQSSTAHPATVLADINVQSTPGGTVTASLPGVIQTTTGGTNTVFATTGAFGDSNLLQHAIQNAVFGSTPSLTLDTTRMAGILSSRTDMDQSQYINDVSPLDANGNALPGIYDKLLPILQQWKTQYNFVGTYFINIGDQPNNADVPTGTDWTQSGPYYQQIVRLGSEIGNHSYTHLINPPTVDANGNPVPLNSLGVSNYRENTNTLYTTAPANGSAPNWTYNYEFGQSKTLEQQNIGITIAGAAVPGAPETLVTAQQIAKYYQSVAGGLTGYVSGGWTGVGAGYPNAFGYLTPTDTGSVYIAPNITFDFTEVEYQKKTVAQALADWETLVNQLSTNSAVPTIVWPWHDYGAAAWDTSGTGAASPYTTQLFTDFIAYAYNKGYEFVTNEGLAARIAAQQRAVLKETTSGNIITATVTPGVATDDLGSMALNVTNGAANPVIQNAGNWYAYDGTRLFLPSTGGTFTVTLGTKQDDVTHIDSLPMRADLNTVTGNGSNLAFSMTGDGVVHVHVKTPGTQIVEVQGAPAATLTGTDLSLTFNDGALAVSTSSPQGVGVQHSVTILESATPTLSTGSNILFGSAGSTLSLTGLHEHYTYNANGTTGETIVDTRDGTPDGTDIVSGIQSFKFADGLTLSIAQLQGTGVSADTGAGVSSTVAGQVLLGDGQGNDITAGANNQILDGGTGDYTLSDGGHSGVTLISGNGNVTFVVTNASTKVIDQIVVGDTIQTDLASFTLPTNVTNLVLNNTTTAQSAYGNGLADTFTASSYHHDSFYFNPSFGKDVITNFSTSAANHDNLDFASSMFAAGTTAASLLAGTAHSAAGGLITAVQTGNNTVIAVDANDTITLNDVNIATPALKLLLAADIHFV